MAMAAAAAGGCVACDVRRAICPGNCIFRPLFANRDSFKVIRKVFGMVNLRRMINECPVDRSALEFEAVTRIEDPTTGVAGLIQQMEQQVGIDPEVLMFDVERCAACALLRRACPPECALRPFFAGSPQSQSFSNVHKIYSIQYLVKLLNEANNDADRQAIVNSMVWEATYRLSHPISGCHGRVLFLEPLIPIMGDPNAPVPPLEFVPAPIPNPNP